MSKVTRRYAVLESKVTKDRRSVVLTTANPNQIHYNLQPVKVASLNGYFLFYAPKRMLNPAKVKLAKHYDSPQLKSWDFIDDLKSGKILDNATTDGYWKIEV